MGADFQLEGGDLGLLQMAEAELVSLFEKASNAAEKAVSDGAVLAAEEMRCQEALKAMGAVEVSTSILLSTQVGGIFIFIFIFSGFDILCNTTQGSEWLSASLSSSLAFAWNVDDRQQLGRIL